MCSDFVGPHSQKFTAEVGALYRTVVGIGTSLKLHGYNSVGPNRVAKGHHSQGSRAMKMHVIPILTLFPNPRAVRNSAPSN